MSESHAEEIAAKAADTVRQAVAEVEAQAGEIIRKAETEAGSIRDRAQAEAVQIRDRAEADARGQIEAAKRALDELGGTLVAAATEAIPAAEVQPEPETPLETPAAPEAPISPPAANGNDAAERLVAMKMAVEGNERAAIEAALAERFGPADRSALLDDVLSRIAG